MRRKLAVLALIAASTFVGITGSASADDARLVAYMTGAAERPGPGDPDGIGRAVITINDAANTICVATQYTGIDLNLTGYHIHIAPPESAGPIVIPLTPPVNQGYECRVVENEALLDNIAANPQQYYINIHNQPFPPGALRGQLQRA